jgi:hypothetical protein
MASEIMGFKECYALACVLGGLYIIFIIYHIKTFEADWDKDKEIAKHNLGVDLGIKEWSFKELLTSWRLYWCVILLVLVIMMFSK